MSKILNIVTFVGAASVTYTVHSKLSKRKAEGMETKPEIYSMIIPTIGALTSLGIEQYGLGASSLLGGIVGLSKSISDLKKLNENSGDTKATSIESFEFKKEPTPLSQMVNRNVSLPKEFKVVVDKYRLDDNGNFYPETQYFWTSEEIDTSVNDWYPASTVKYLAAIGAAKTLGDLGYSPNVEITFKDRGGKMTKKSYNDLLTEALVASDNISYDRLVQIAGHSDLHELLNVYYPTLKMNRPYMKDQWQSLTGSREFDANDIILEEGGERSIIPPTQHIEASSICPNRSSCGALNDYSLSMADLVFNPEVLGLKEEHRQAILQRLSTPKARGTNLINGITSARGFPEFYHKPGFAIDYFSDAIVLVDRPNKVAYAIAGMGFPGRNSLDDIAKAIGELMQQGAI